MNATKITELEMNEIFAQNLHFLRKSGVNPLSQKALARILKLSHKTISRYEAGRGMLSAHAVYLIASYFDYSVEEILTKKLF